MTLTCTALSYEGEKDAKSIDIRTKQKVYFKILEYPKDKTVKYKNKIDFKCIVDAFPEVNITWFKDHEKITNDTNYNISKDSSTLTIKSMNTGLIGNYHVKIVNDYEAKDFPFKIAISGIDSPKIDKRTVIYYREIGQSIDLPCRY
ncbi:disorganized muscle protein 1-like [Vanessa cardui]|uniref:disorganized muscle protein 1-like n=1 Tax=Vanessa cardui TaxID=171605 RepID=UPI001F141AAB|nr:disorganized muscle protein 1-like [Vanessa cardui]